MTLPLVIAPNDPGHIDDHQEIHTLLGGLDGQSTFLAAGSTTGALGSRPAASASNRGNFYFAASVPSLAFSDGAVWREQVLASAANTFTAINNFTDDVFFGSGKPWVDVMHSSYGAAGDGTTDDTNAVQLAADAAAAGDRVLFFPPARAGYYMAGRVHLDSTYSGLRIVGESTILIHHVSGLDPIGGSDTKALPIFMLERDCNRIEITGFVFRSSGTFAALIASAPQYVSYFSPIVVHNADDVWIHHNRFEGTSPRAIFQHGGDRLRVEHNHMGAQGMILHVGYVNNPYFYDAGASDLSRTFSPLGPRIANNTWQSYSQPYACLFLSGANYFNVTGNKFLDCNTTDNVIEVYTNDFGLQTNGTPVLEMFGEVGDNFINGTANYALFFNGYSTSATGQLHVLNIDVHDNTAKVTGNGVNLERASRIRVHHNRIDVTKIIVRFAREVYDFEVCSNDLLSTGTPTGDRAINIASVADMQDGRICDNDIYVGSGSQFLMTDAASNTFENIAFRGNVITVETTVASPTMINLADVTGHFDLSYTQWIVNSATMVDRQLVVVAGNADVTLVDHRVISSSVELARHEFNVDSVRIADSVVPGVLITASGVVALSNSDFTLSATGTTETIKVTSSRYFSMTACLAESTPALALPVVHVDASTATHIIGGRVIGNSSVPLLRQSTSGVLTASGVTQTNSGAGGTSITKTGSATAFTADLSAA